MENYEGSVRVFFAIDLPSSIKEEVGSLIRTIKDKIKLDTIQWTKIENLHVTLQFLASVKREDLPPLIHSVRSQIKGIKPFKLLFSDLKLFPHPDHPHAIVLDIALQDKLEALSQSIGRGIYAAHYEMENRPFRAHLTLGRIKQLKGLTFNFISECVLPRIEDIEISEAVLFRSELQPEGSIYTVIEKFPLG